MKPQLNFLWIFTLLLTSCVFDPYYHANITNKTSQNILLEIQFDKPSFNGKSFILYANGASEIEGGTVISTDTINWILKYELKPDEYYTVEYGPGNKPNFSKVKSIHIFDRDTILLNSKEKMFDLFKNKEGNTFEFEIK